MDTPLTPNPKAALISELQVGMQFKIPPGTPHPQLQGGKIYQLVDKSATSNWNISPASDLHGLVVPIQKSTSIIVVPTVLTVTVAEVPGYASPAAGIALPPKKVHAQVHVAGAVRIGHPLPIIGIKWTDIDVPIDLILNGYIWVNSISDATQPIQCTHAGEAFWRCPINHSHEFSIKEAYQNDFICMFCDSAPWLEIRLR